MNRGLWYDFKVKFLKSGNPAMLYIGLNALIFVVLTLAVLIGSIGGYGTLIDGYISYYLKFSADPDLWLTHFYTVLTYQFLHANFFHLFFNLLFLYWVGQLLLDFVKPRQFHLVYLGGGILGAICFALIYNLIPFFNGSVQGATLEGASAAVMAVFTALATLVPNYNLRLMFLGNVKIKYLLLVYIFLDLIGTTSTNAGGSISHLGGAMFGFIYIKLLQNGTDLSTIFRRKPKLKVVKNENPRKSADIINQKEVDAILDKISKSGYDKLSREEKETLFKASKN